jgi:hypothetical protein
MAIFQRLAATTVWSRCALVIGRSFRMRLYAPVRPDTTLHGQLQWKRVSEAAHGRSGIDFLGQLTDQEGAVVFEVDGDVVMARRNAG